MSSPEPGSKNLEIKWTRPAEAEVEQIAGQPRFQGVDAKKWHEDRVREYGETLMPQATKARIRKPAHKGGDNPKEPEHITVTFRMGNRDLGAHHVYTEGQ